MKRPSTSRRVRSTALLRDAKCSALVLPLCVRAANPACFTFKIVHLGPPDVDVWGLGAEHLLSKFLPCEPVSEPLPATHSDPCRPVSRMHPVHPPQPFALLRSSQKERTQEFFCTWLFIYLTPPTTSGVGARGVSPLLLRIWLEP